MKKLVFSLVVISVLSLGFTYATAQAEVPTVGACLSCVG